MGKRKSKQKNIYIFILAFIVIYLFWAIKIDFEVRNIVRKSYENYGDNVLDYDIVSSDIFERMCYRNGYRVSSKNNQNVSEVNELSLPIAIHWFAGAKVYYWYTYEISDKQTGELYGGSYNILVSLTVKYTLTGLNVIDYYEAP